MRRFAFVSCTFALVWCGCSGRALPLPEVAPALSPDLSGLSGPFDLALRPFDLGSHSAPDLRGAPDLGSCRTAFEIAQQAYWPMLPNGAVSGDFNGDGNLDLLVADLGSGGYSALGSLTVDGQLLLFLGRGDGSLEDPRSFALPPSSRPYSLLVGDFDQDGLSDAIVYRLLTDDRFLIVGDDATLELWRGHADGSLVASTIGVVPRSFPTVGDLDDDGRLDLLVSNLNGSTLFRGLGNGSFDAVDVPSVTNYFGHDTVIADLDGDGHSDVAVIETGYIDLFLGAGGNSFTAAPQALAFADQADGNVHYNYIRAADLDSDGVLDLVAEAVITGGVSLLRGNGQGGFDGAVTLNDDQGAPLVGYFPVVADLDGDGVPELAGRNFQLSSEMEVARRDASGRYQVGTLPLASFYSLAAGDFDGDGRKELVAIGDSTVQQVRVQPDGPQLDRSVGGSDIQGVALLTTDDGVDLIMSNTRGNGLTLRHLAGNGDLGPEMNPVAVAPLYGSFCSGDFDGDGRPEMVNGGDQTWTLVRRAPDGSYSAASLDLPAGHTCAGTADLDGDGRIDLILRRDLDGEILMAPGNGDGSFAPPADTGVAVPSTPQILDVDGDQRADLVWLDPSYNPDLDHLEIAYGDGKGKFGPPAGYAAGSFGVFYDYQPAEKVAVADLDGDGRRDLIVLDGEHQGLQLLLGRAGGTFAPPVALSLGDWPRSVAVADLDGDGRMDVVASVSAGVAWLAGQADGTLGAPSLIAIPGDAAGWLGITDVDGDGRPDLISVGRPSNRVTVLGNRCR